MKYLIILISTLLFQCSGSKSSDKSWDEINYNYNSGTVPPPYYYSFSIKIKSNREGRITYAPDYDDKNTWGYDFKITKKDLKDLTSKIESSKIMEKEIESMPDNMRPIGGSIHYGSILFEKEGVIKKHDLPGFPVSESMKNELENIFNRIRAFVPKEIWDDIEIRKNNYIEQFKDK
jgi:hypothetical protein